MECGNRYEIKWKSGHVEVIKYHAAKQPGVVVLEHLSTNLKFSAHEDDFSIIREVKEAK